MRLLCDSTLVLFGWQVGPPSLCCKQGLKADKGVSVDNPIQNTGPTGSTVLTPGRSASNSMIAFAAALAAFALAKDYLGQYQGHAKTAKTPVSLGWQTLVKDL